MVIDDEIISDNTELLQRNFAFQDFIKVTAIKAVSDIQSLGLISNMDKLSDYISRSKPIYARKMMRIKNSKVINKTKEELYQRVTTLPRWRGKFDIDTENKQIILSTYTQVENLIDLLDERYTRSDVTDEEYDTGAKKWIAPMTI